MLALYTNLSLRLRSDEKGATAVEYGLMVALVAVLIIAAVALLGEGMRDAFTQIQCGVNGGTYANSTNTAGGGACTGGRV